MKLCLSVSCLRGEFCENQIMIVNIDELELTDALKACYDRLTLSDHYNHKLTKLTHSLMEKQDKPNQEEQKDENIVAQP